MTDELKNKINEFKKFYSNYPPAIKTKIILIPGGQFLTISIFNPSGSLISSASKYVKTDELNTEIENLTIEAIERCL